MTFPHGYFAIDVDLIAVRGEPIEDCVCYAATAQLFMPSFNGNLWASKGGVSLLIEELIELANKNDTLSSFSNQDSGGILVCK